LHANLKCWSFYVDLLENLGHNEQTKKAYERMMDLKIATPQTILNYSRYADSKVERIRDLFNQVLTKVPAKQSKVFFYMYADFEENFGLLTHAMEIYDKASKEMSDAGL